MASAGVTAPIPETKRPGPPKRVSVRHSRLSMTPPLAAPVRSNVLPRVSSTSNEEREDSDGIEVMIPEDGRLGLTNYGDKPADDWAADTGETKTPE